MLIGQLADDTTCSLYRQNKSSSLFSLLMLFYYRLKVQTLSSYDTIVVLYYVSFCSSCNRSSPNKKSLRLRLKNRQLVFCSLVLFIDSLRRFCTSRLSLSGWRNLSLDMGFNRGTQTILQKFYLMHFKPYSLAN